MPIRRSFRTLQVLDDELQTTQCGRFHSQLEGRQRLLHKVFEKQEETLAKWFEHFESGDMPIKDLAKWMRDAISPAKLSLVPASDNDRSGSKRISDGADGTRVEALHMAQDNVEKRSTSAQAGDIATAYLPYRPPGIGRSRACRVRRVTSLSYEWPFPTQLEYTRGYERTRNTFAFIHILVQSPICATL
jgi:hypothetical protein